MNKSDLIYDLGLTDVQIKRLVSYEKYLHRSSEYHLHLRMFEGKWGKIEFVYNKQK